MLFKNFLYLYIQCKQCKEAVMRITVAYTIEKKIAERFKKVAEEKFINRSELIESFIEAWLKENSKNK